MATLDRSFVRAPGRDPQVARPAGFSRGLDPGIARARAGRRAWRLRRLGKRVAPQHVRLAQARAQTRGSNQRRDRAAVASPRRPLADGAWWRIGTDRAELLRD